MIESLFSFVCYKNIINHSDIISTSMSNMVKQTTCLFEIVIQPP